MPDEPSGTDRALDLLVYGPIGLAAYLRDTAPSFLKLFVSRGRAIVDGQRKSVEGQLGQARVVGQFASVEGAPRVRRAVIDALGAARARTEDALEYLGGVAGVTPTPAGAPDTDPDLAPLAFRVVPQDQDGGAPLPIRDYDELSASQVVERLEGLPRDELNAIRAYEATHRARNTVLGKIEQLQRPVG